MAIPNPPWPPRSVGEVLGTGQLPDTMTGILAIRFQTVHEDGGGLPTEKRADRGFHSFLAHFASGVDPVPSLDRL